MRMPEALHPGGSQTQSCSTDLLARRRLNLMFLARRRPRFADSLSRSLAASEVTKVALRALRLFSRERLFSRLTIFCALARALRQAAPTAGGAGGGAAAGGAGREGERRRNWRCRRSGPRCRRTCCRRW